MKIRVRIQLARQGQFAAVAHGLGHVAVQVVDGGDGRGGPTSSRTATHRSPSISSTPSATPAPQRQQHAVHWQRGAQAVEDAAFHLSVGLGLDGAGRCGLADVGADQFRAGLPRAFDEAANLVVGFVEGLQDLVLAAVLLEGAQRVWPANSAA